MAATKPLMADSAPEASAQDTKKMVQNNFVETAQKGIKLSGYVDAGYSYNFTGQNNNSMVATRYATDTAQRGISTCTRSSWLWKSNDFGKQGASWVSGGCDDR